MTTDKPLGIAHTLLAILNETEKAKLIKDQLKFYSETGEAAIATQKSKTARTTGKAQKTWPKKTKAAEQFIRLTRLGKKISAQNLFNTLIKQHPEEKWNYNTIRDWHKLMVAGMKNAPNESPQVVWVAD